MSSSCGYLVPDKTLPVGKFSKLVKGILDDLKITKGYYDKKADWLAAGPNSFHIFSDNANNHPIAFEYASIHDNSYKRLVPESFGGGAACGNCGQNIDDAVSDKLSELYEYEFDNGKETDITQLEIICNYCSHNNKLAEIKFGYETILTNQYFQFVDIERNFNADTLIEIGKQLGCNLKVFYDRY